MPFSWVCGYVMFGHFAPQCLHRCNGIPLVPHLFSPLFLLFSTAASSPPPPPPPGDADDTPKKEKTGFFLVDHAGSIGFALALSFLASYIWRSKRGIDNRDSLREAIDGERAVCPEEIAAIRRQARVTCVCGEGDSGGLKGGALSLQPCFLWMLVCARAALTTTRRS